MTPAELQLQTELSSWLPLAGVWTAYVLAVIALLAFGRGPLSLDPRTCGRPHQ